MESCAHCGTQGTSLKRCVRCMYTWYCGAECQKAGWKVHKKTTCISLTHVWDQVLAANAVQNWRGVLEWEGRMESLMDFQWEDKFREHILAVFIRANSKATAAEDRMETKLSALKLRQRRVEILGRMERYRDQGTEMCAVATNFIMLSHQQEAASWWQRARALGAGDPRNPWYLLERVSPTAAQALAP